MQFTQIIEKELWDYCQDQTPKNLRYCKREYARARIRSNIKRLLIKYNYHPVKRDGAVEKVIKQAELKYEQQTLDI